MNLIKKLFFNQIDSLASAAIVLGFFSLASKVLGLARDRILYGTFGAGDELDMYYAAFRIPDTIFNLLIIGALSASFVPILSKYFYRKEDALAWKTINDVLNIFLFSVILGSLILAVFAPVLLKFIVPGWSGEKFEVTLTLTRIMLLSPIFLTVSSVAGAALQSSKRFIMFAFAPVVYNAGIIIGAVFFVKSMGIYGLALGVILGSALHFLAQLPVLFSLGYKYKISFDLKNPDVRRIFKIMLPRTLSLGVNQINFFIITIFASLLASGSLSIFYLASNIHNIFFGLIGISFSVAAFPALSAYLANGEKEKFTAVFSRTMREIIFFIIPATVFLIVFRSEIVHFIGGRGNIDYIATKSSLVFLALGLAAQSLVSQIVRTFWALGDTKTPFYASLFGLAANVGAATWFVFYSGFGVVGLAIAFSLTNIVNFFMLYFFLRRKINYLDEARVVNSFVRIFAASLLGGSAVWFLANLFPGDFDKMGGLALVARLTAGFIATALAFSFFAWIFHVRELSMFVKAVKRRLVNIFATNVAEADGGSGKI
ncbi:MAG: murein biosynthesis integral membrane protein MurJ [Patescibacteria group bacterium]|nr:murein biosynthesis integral membrane protein MurJ [Patescibacteria group bacterium]